MSEASHSGPAPVPGARRVDQICDRFEAAWGAGRPPTIEEFLGELAEPERHALLRELVLLDVYYRRRRGEDCQLADYTSRFPSLDAAWLAATLALSPVEPPDSSQPVPPDPSIRQGSPNPADGCSPLGAAHTRIEGTLSAPFSDRQEQTSGPTGQPDLSAPALPAGAVGAGLRYRALRFHAKGGLGEVLVAEDSELRRQVALKRIQECYADSAELRRRFVREAEITARLEHPGIVPVHGLVHDAGGKPCYAMRFIEGESLREAIERFHKKDVPSSSSRAGAELGERPVEFRRLLGRFIAVCETIAYAHNRGVLHRDLKPANIMLGKYGETLVVDWGLAKVIGEAGQESAGAGKSDSERVTLKPAPGRTAEPGTIPGSHSLTDPGEIVGTPQFMSPEQAGGGLDRLGPASDVYSLGATLYCLLTGQTPFTDPDIMTVFLQVHRGDFPRPRQVKPSVPAPLEAICLKAMALDPKERYASPRLLADDLEHWLAGEPVTAWPEPWTARTRRWLGRHRPLVTGAAAAVLVATAALAVAAVLLNAAKDRERDAKEQAQEQKETAEQNYRLARQAVDHYHTEVSEAVLLDEPGLQPLRRKLLQDARAFYARFVHQRAGDPGARGELGKALFRLAQITGDIGSKREAIDLHRRALNALTLAGPGYANDRAACLHHLGRLYRITDQLDRAETSYRKALDIWDELVRAQPEDRYLAGRARSQLGLGNVSLLRHRLDEARVLYQQARTAQDHLAKAHSKVVEYRRDLAVTYSNLGMVYRTTGQAQMAEEAFHKAVKIQQDLVREFAHISKYQDDLARSYNNLGALYDFLKQFTRAAEPYQNAAAIWTALRNKHPTVTDFQNRLADAYISLARVYTAAGQTVKAVSACRQALAITTTLVWDHKAMPRFRADLARAHFQLGSIYRADRRPEKAESAFLEAIHIQERLTGDLPSNAHYQSQLAKTYNNLGLVYLDKQDTEKAGKVFHKAIGRLETLVTDHPLDLEFQVDLRISCCNRGRVSTAEGKLKDAVKWYSRALAPLGKDRRRPPPPAARPVLRDAHWKRAEVLTELGRYPDALRDWGQALGLAAPAQKNWFRLYRALTQARSGEHALAAQEAKILTCEMNRSAEALYLLACVLARAAEAAARDGTLTPEHRHQAADRYGADAVALLDKAETVGYFKAKANRKKLAREAHLDALRPRLDFQKLLDRLRK
jgi:serine/threonine-protein kinase